MSLVIKFFNWVRIWMLKMVNGIRTAIRSIGKHYLSAFSDTFFVFVFTVLPTILLLLKNILYSQSITDHALYKSGEFLLYSVSFFSSSYIVFDQMRFKTDDWKKGLVKLVLIPIVIVSALYALAMGTEEPNMPFLKWVSIVSLLVSVMVFYGAQSLLNKRSPDLGKKRKEEIEIIEAQLHD